MTTLGRINARLSPRQLNRLADLLDEICDGEYGGSFIVSFRARPARHHTRVTARFAKDEEIGNWPDSDAQAELPLNGKNDVRRLS